MFVTTDWAFYLVYGTFPYKLQEITFECIIGLKLTWFLILKLCMSKLDFSAPFNIQCTTLNFRYIYSKKKLSNKLIIWHMTAPEELRNMGKSLEGMIQTPKLKQKGP